MVQFSICKFVHGSMSDSIHCTIIFPLPVHDYDTRNSNLLRKPRVNSSRYGLNSLAFRGPLLYNALPQSVKSATSTQAFHLLLKKFLLSNDVVV